MWRLFVKLAEKKKEETIMRKQDLCGVGIVMVFCIFLIFALPHGCTDPDTTQRVLRQQGYTNVEITGWRPFMKSDSDAYSTGFVATAPNGERVSGAVTSGWFKGATVRMD